MEERFMFLFIFLVIYLLLNQNGATSKSESTKSAKRKYFKWKIEHDAALIYIDEWTKTENPNNLDGIISEWHQRFPNYNVTDAALRKRVSKLRRESKEEGENNKKLFMWNEPLNIELVNTYYNTNPYKPLCNQSIIEAWKQKHKDYEGLQGNLMKRVRNFLKEHPEYRRKEPLEPNFRFNNQQDSDLMHAHQTTKRVVRDYMKDIHRIWSELHPQHSNVTLLHLRERLKHLERNPPDKLFPWTEALNQELLHIYHKTMPDKEDQGQRIYDIWSKIHPRYKFMTPYYLQVHASRLAHENEIEAGGSSRKLMTGEQRSALVELCDRFQGRRCRAHSFHEEWTRRCPKLAYLTTKNLYLLGKRFEYMMTFDPTKEWGRATKTESRKMRRRENFTPQMKQELLALYDSVPGHNGERLEQLLNKWNIEHKDRSPVPVEYLRTYAHRWRHERSNRASEKEPMVDSSPK